MRELVERVGRPDVCLIDPPRAGLSAKVVRRIIEAAPNRIVYVSCNPTTLAPNAAQLVEAGWTLEPSGRSTCSRSTPHRVGGAARAQAVREAGGGARAAPAISYADGVDGNVACRVGGRRPERVGPPSP